MLEQWNYLQHGFLYNWSDFATQFWLPKLARQWNLMIPVVYKRETNVPEIIVCYCFPSVPKNAGCFNGYNNLAFPIPRLKALPLCLTLCYAVSSQMPLPQGTQSLGWLTAPSRPATASGPSQSRCLCTPRSSPPFMKVRVCYYLHSIASAFPPFFLFLFPLLSPSPLRAIFNYKLLHYFYLDKPRKSCFVLVFYTWSFECPW